MTVQTFFIFTSVRTLKIETFQALAELISQQNKQTEALQWALSSHCTSQNGAAPFINTLFINSHLQHQQTHHCTASACTASDPHHVWQSAYKTPFTLQQTPRMFLVSFFCFFTCRGAAFCQPQAISGR